MAIRIRYFQGIADLQNFVKREMRAQSLITYSSLDVSKHPELKALLHDVQLEDVLTLPGYQDKSTEGWWPTIEGHLYDCSVCLISNSSAAAEQIQRELSELFDSEKRYQGALYHFAFVLTMPLAKERLLELLEVRAYAFEGQPDSGYESVGHFLSRAFPSFSDNLQKASLYIAEIVTSLNIETVVDVGCGDGAMLLQVAQKCGPKIHYIGLDRTPQQISHAEQLERTVYADTGANVLFIRSEFENYLIEKQHLSNQNYVLLFLGQTLAHIGPRALGRWLQAEQYRPKYIVFDMYWEWPLYVKQPQASYFTTPLQLISDDTLTSASRVYTIYKDGRIQRGIDIAYYENATGAPVAKHSMATLQYPNLLEDYEDVLRSNGYEVRPKARYDHGWGSFEIQVANLSPAIQHPRGEWPQPKETTGQALNRLWYKTLSDLWRSAEAEQAGGNLAKDLIADLKLFPVAILPFGEDAVGARYIKHATGESAAECMAQAWMRLVDRNAKDSRLPPGGSYKPYTDPPYAAGLFDALLADVPAAFVTSISDTVLPFALNGHDERLEQLEHEVLAAQAGTAFYALPVFPCGLPAFCLIGRSSNLSNIPPLTVMAIFQADIERYERFFAQCLNDNAWRRFLRSCQDEVGFNCLDKLTTQAKKWNWKSWVETIPGQALNDAPRRVEEALRFESFHTTEVEFLARTCHQQISEILKAVKFFEAVKIGGCGHERVTRRHRSTAKRLLISLELVAPQYQRAYAMSYLEGLEQCDDSTLPDDDSRKDLTDQNADYDQVNWEFQKFKSLFCRNDQNRKDDYRLSPLMVWTFLRFRNKGIVLSIAGQESPARFDEGNHVRPKIVVLGDPWTRLELLSAVLELTQPVSLEIGGAPNPPGVYVQARFRSLYHVDEGTAGAGMGPVLRAFSELTAIDTRAGDVNGFVINFKNRETPEHQWRKSSSAT